MGALEVTDGRPQWGAIAFACLFALIALSVLAGPLLDALPPAGRTEVRADAGEARANDRRPLPEELHARWHAQSAPSTIRVGEVAEVSMQFQNVGRVPWIRGTPSELRLAEVGASVLPAEMRVDWPYPDRPAVQSEVIVHPLQLANFDWRIKGSAPGTYRMQVRPVIDGVAWLGDEGIYVEITVR